MTENFIYGCPLRHRILLWKPNDLATSNFWWGRWNSSHKGKMKRKYSSIAYADEGDDEISQTPPLPFAATNTRFDEIPPEVLSIIIDHVPLGSLTVLQLILTSSRVYSAFRDHPFYVFHQFRSVHPSLDDFLCSNSIMVVAEELSRILNEMRAKRGRSSIEWKWRCCRMRNSRLESFICRSIG